MIFHFSEQPNIARFDPRPAPSGNASAPTGDMVWAIGSALEHNYLLPRDCPRVCFSAFPHSDPADIARLIGPTTAHAIIAIEASWLPAIRSATLYRYSLPTTTFELIDAAADYYVSRQAVVPLAVEPIPDLLDALLRRNIELRITPNLWPLCDAVIASSLRFSCIRMRNATPRPAETISQQVQGA